MQSILIPLVVVGGLAVFAYTIPQNNDSKNLNINKNIMKIHHNRYINQVSQSNPIQKLRTPPRGNILINKPLKHITPSKLMKLSTPLQIDLSKFNNIDINEKKIQFTQNSKFDFIANTYFEKNSTMANEYHRVYFMLPYNIIDPSSTKLESHDKHFTHILKAYTVKNSIASLPIVLKKNGHFTFFDFIINNNDLRSITRYLNAKNINIKHISSALWKIINSFNFNIKINNDFKFIIKAKRFITLTFTIDKKSYKDFIDLQNLLISNYFNDNNDIKIIVPTNNFEVRNNTWKVNTKLSPYNYNATTIPGFTPSDTNIYVPEYYYNKTTKFELHMTIYEITDKKYDPTDFIKYINSLIVK